MDKNNEIKELAIDLQKFQLQLSGNSNTCTELQQELASRINYLITHDFSLLISILYRLDISEKKLKQLLSQSIKTTAGDIIAEMIVERQLQKIQSRKASNNDRSSIPDEERW